MSEYSIFPKALDGYAQLPLMVDRITPINAEGINRLRSAIVNIEAALGVNPQGDFNSTSERIGSIEIDIDKIFSDIEIINEAIELLEEAVVRAQETADNAQEELDNTQVGAGLDFEGSYVQESGANYIFDAVSLFDADLKLDSSLKAESDLRASADTLLQDNIDAEALARSDGDSALQSEVDNTQAGAGLSADGSYAANGSANYIAAATSLKDADDKLDAALNAEELARSGADSSIQSEVDAIETSMGAMVNSSGVYQQFSGTNYIDGNADLTQDLLDLDAAIASVSGGSGITDVVDDLTPQLGGDLDVNGSDITGTGNIDITGAVTADLFEGQLNGPVFFRAQAGEAISKGEVVYISGISGNTPIVMLAQANSPLTMPAFGIAVVDIPINTSGEIASFGSVKGLDAAIIMDTGSPPTLGSTLYVCPVTAGKLSETPPSGESNLIQNIGKAERVFPSTNMTVKVGGAGRSNATPALNDGNIFIGDASNNSVTASLQAKIIENLNSGNIVVDDQRVNLPEAPNNTVEYVGWNRADAEIISASVYCDTVNTNGSLTLDLININAVGAPSCFSTPYNMNGLSPQTVTIIPLSLTPSDLQFSAGDPWRLEIVSNDPAMNAQGIYVMLSFKRSL